MSEITSLLNTLRVRLKEIFDLERRLRELLHRLREAEFPGSAHAATHSEGGVDEVDVTGLGGFPGGGTTFLRDDGTWAAAGAGTPSATVAPLDGTGAAGVSTDYSRGDHKHADANRPTDDEKDALAGTGTPSAANPYVTASTFATHAARHENGGADEINVGGLNGVLADPQTVDTDAAGALDGDGSTGSPLAVRVDGVSVTINGSNELEATATGEIHRAITFVIDGGGATITTGIKGDLSIPFDCLIVGVRLLADQNGAIVIDIWKDVYANYPPDNSDSITASAPPTIASSNDSSEDTTLTGWGAGKTITAGDTLRFNVDSVTSIQRVTLILDVTT